MAKVKGFSGIRPGFTKEFTPPIYIEEGKEKTGQEPVFTLTYPTVSQKQAIYDKFYDGGHIARGMTGDCFEAVICPNVNGMRNCPMAYSTEIDGKTLAQAIYDQFDFDLRGELFSEIMTGGEMDAEEANAVKS